jgi:hypothetical protein
MSTKSFLQKSRDFLQCHLYYFGLPVVPLNNVQMRRRVRTCLTYFQNTSYVVYRTPESGAPGN